MRRPDLASHTIDTVAVPSDDRHTLLTAWLGCSSLVTMILNFEAYSGEGLLWEELTGGDVLDYMWLPANRSFLVLRRYEHTRPLVCYEPSGRARDRGVSYELVALPENPSPPPSSPSREPLLQLWPLFHSPLQTVAADSSNQIWTSLSGGSLSLWSSSRRRRRAHCSGQQGYQHTWLGCLSLYPPLVDDSGGCTAAAPRFCRVPERHRTWAELTDGTLVFSDRRGLYELGLAAAATAPSAMDGQQQQQQGGTLRSWLVQWGPPAGQGQSHRLMALPDERLWSLAVTNENTLQGTIWSSRGQRLQQWELSTQAPFHYATLVLPPPHGSLWLGGSTAVACDGGAAQETLDYWQPAGAAGRWSAVVGSQHGNGGGGRRSGSLPVGKQEIACLTLGAFTQRLLVGFWGGRLGWVRFEEDSSSSSSSPVDTTTAAGSGAATAAAPVAVPSWSTGDQQAVVGALCELPNGTIVSGDAEGNVRFWAWSTARKSLSIEKEEEKPPQCLLHHRLAGGIRRISYQVDEQCLYFFVEEVGLVLVVL